MPVPDRKNRNSCTALWLRPRSVSWRRSTARNSRWRVSRSHSLSFRHGGPPRLVSRPGVAQHPRVQCDPPGRRLARRISSIVGQSCRGPSRSKLGRSCRWDNDSVLLDLLAELPVVEPYRDSDVDRSRNYQLALDPKFPFQIRLLSYSAAVLSNPLRFNWHERLEILVPVAGHGSFRMGEREFDFVPGDIIVVDNLKLHGPLSYRGQERLLTAITFLPDLISNPLSYPCDSTYLSPFYSRSSQLDPRVRTTDKASADICAAIVNMLHSYLDEAAAVELRRAGCKVFLLQVLHYLSLHFGMTGR